MKFSITGGNGFLGVHLIHHLLKHGHDVEALYRPGSSLAEFELIKPYYGLNPAEYAKLRWHECNYENPLELDAIFNDTDFIVHLAGSISYSKKDKSALLMTNTELTKYIVNAALRVKAKKLIYCSSIAALGKNNSEKLVSEESEWRQDLPHSFYGYSKHLGELETWRAIEEGLNAIIINPGIVLGYGSWNKGSNALFKNAFTQFPFYSTGITGFIGVEDVSKVIALLCESNISNQQFVLTSENHSYQHISNLMADAFVKRKPKYEVKGILLGLVKILVFIKEILGMGGLITKETTRAAVAKNKFDNAKIREALNISFEPLQKVISKSVKWYKKSPSE